MQTFLIVMTGICAVWAVAVGIWLNYLVVRGNEESTPWGNNIGTFAITCLTGWFAMAFAVLCWLLWR